jgi:hypothetical protein
MESIRACLYHYMFLNSAPLDNCLILEILIYKIMYVDTSDVISLCFMKVSGFAEEHFTSIYCTCIAHVIIVNTNLLYMG